MKRLLGRQQSTNPVTTPDSQATAPESKKAADPVNPEPPSPSENPRARRRQFVLWGKFAPFLLSGLFFYSLIFAVFSPVPLLMVFLKSGFGPLLLATLTNSAVVALLGGLPALGLYLVFVATIGLSLPFWVYVKKQKPDRAIFLTFATSLLVAAAILSAYALSKGATPWAEGRRLLTEAVDFMVTASLSQNPKTFGDIPVEELKKEMVQEFPWLCGAFGLLVAWMNFVMFFRMNPFRMKEVLGIEFTYFKTWKAPEWLVWPLIVCGAGMLLAKGVPHVISVNLLKFLLVVYGLQGVSILSYVLDFLRVKGLVRTLVYVVTTLFMTPFLVGLGFFDLWFDFRSKLRQS